MTTETDSEAYTGTHDACRQTDIHTDIDAQGYMNKTDTYTGYIDVFTIEAMI